MRYRVNSPQVINETIDGEAIMINLATGSYYSLDRVGGDVWTLLEAWLPAARIFWELRPRRGGRVWPLLAASLPVEQIVGDPRRRYDGDEGDIRRGVDDLLQRLAEE